MIKQIDKVFKGRAEVKGVIFTQIKRKGMICIYERSDNCFEVVKLREQKARDIVLGGKKISLIDKELYPTGEGWEGKCVNSLERAEEEFKKMIKYGEL